jgi:hypothetical protein
MPAARAALLASFVAHFQRAIAQEMDAMRERMGSFEVALADGQAVESEDEKDRGRYAFRLMSTDEKLVPGMDCSLRVGTDEYLVRVERLESAEVTLSSVRDVELGSGEGTLVIYPWFLYEKLRAVLNDLNADHFSVDRALALFGKLPTASRRRTLLREHDGLNASQRAAVQLCADSDLAFVWGPPGTGKTTTLAHIVDELLAQGLRLLVLSTTNAAVDQALAKIAQEPAMAEAIERGAVVRIGRSEAPTFGAGLRDVVSRLHGVHREALDRHLSRRPEVDEARRKCKQALTDLTGADAPLQQSLFEEEADPRHAAVDLEGVFCGGRLRLISRLPPRERLGILRRRTQRLGRLRDLLDEQIGARRKALANKEQGVVDQAALVLSTLTNAYFSPLLRDSRFDVVVVEEASMAILPALFYAACLGCEKTVMVGDPCQLPAIVQSDAPYVRQVMGRNIFEVTVPEPLSSPLVAMLDVQYRMHPAIGQLVSESFYFGKLKHEGDPARLAAIAGFEPYPGEPLVVLDTAGCTECQQSPRGQSRLNPKTAEACVDLALQAIESGAESAAIITPYADQARAIRALLKDHGDDAANIECSTVHRFQGRECDVVILDTVDAEPMRPGVLLNERGPNSSALKLVNVAISRARGKLIIVADVAYFKEKAPDGVVSKVIARALSGGRREVWDGRAT